MTYLINDELENIINVLVDYFAVDSKLRGQGLGGGILRVSGTLGGRRRQCR